MSTSGTDIEELVIEAARPIPLLWPLSSYVATNPLWDLRSSSFHAAVQIEQHLLGINGYPHPGLFADAWSRGRITPADLDAVLDDATASPAAGEPFDTDQRAGVARGAMTLLERIGAAPLADRADAEISRWCAAFAGRTLPDADGRADPRRGSFYSAWRDVAAADRTARQLGVAGLLRRLPAGSTATVETCLARLGLGHHERLGELTGQLARQIGWAGYAKWRTLWAPPEDPRPFLGLIDYLAVRLVYDVALLAHRPLLGQSTEHTARSQRLRHATPDWSGDRPETTFVEGSVAARLASLSPHCAAAVWLAAYENSYRDRLLASLSRDEYSTDHRVPCAQVICCIDARAEGLRRHLEERGRYETFGAAGFFALPARIRPFGSDEFLDLSPALVRPAVEVALRPGDAPQATAALGRAESLAAARDALAEVRERAVTPYLVAEAMGIALGPLALLRTVAPRAFTTLRRFLARRVAPTPGLDFALSGSGAPDDRAQARHAEALLRSIGLTDGFARIVVLCGHGSTSENNAYASALDCGACGAARGGTSARLAAAMLNRGPVRTLLARHGIIIPADTVFVGAEHDTATDAVSVFPPEEREADRQHLELLTTLCADLNAAGRALATERVATLPGAERAHRWRRGSDHVATRSADWAQVQPEWGLAGNATLIVAPRRLTRGVDLERRAFLHSYEPDADLDGTILEAILGGPMIVAHWISAAYYFSTVDPETLGAGDKAAHNIVAGIGVYLGAGRDLRVGLPYQSVFTRDRAYHEPMRLLVVVEAPRQRIDAILGRNRVVSDVVAGKWVNVVARDDERFWVLAGDLSWKRWRPATGEPEVSTLAHRL